MKKKSKRPIRKIIVKKNCIFCRSDTNPDYKNPSQLERFISSKGKILPAVATGTCMKHQRKIKKEIKRARFLAILPFVNL